LTEGSDVPLTVIFFLSYTNSVFWSILSSFVSSFFAIKNRHEKGRCPFDSFRPLFPLLAIRRVKVLLSLFLWPFCVFRTGFALLKTTVSLVPFFFSPLLRSIKRSTTLFPFFFRSLVLKSAPDQRQFSSFLSFALYSR